MRDTCFELLMKLVDWLWMGRKTESASRPDACLVKTRQGRG